MDECLFPLVVAYRAAFVFMKEWPVATVETVVAMGALRGSEEGSSTP